MNKSCIVLFATGLLVLAGCGKEFVQTGSDAIAVEASVGEMTKATDNAFTPGDRIAVYAWTGSATEVPANRVVNGVVNAFDGSKWTPAAPMQWKSASDAHYFLGISPAQAAPFANLTAVPYTLNPADYAASDLLLAANLTGVKSSDGPVPLVFGHAMARLRVNLKFRSQWGSVPDAVSVSVTAKSAATVNVLTKAVSASDAAGAVSVPAAAAAATGYDLGFSGIQVPQDGVRTITVTVDGLDYVYESPSDIPLVSGQQTELNLILGKDMIELSGVIISDWICEVAPSDVEVQPFKNDVKIPTGLVLSFLEVDKWGLNDRGVDDIRLVPYFRQAFGDMVSLPSIASSTSLFPGSGGKVFDAVGLPMGTSAAIVYAKATDIGTDPFQNGALDISGLSGKPSLDGILFSPVPVCTEIPELEGELLSVLNAVANAKPMADLSDATRPAFKDVTSEQSTTIAALWTHFSTLNVLSSSNVEYALKELYMNLDGLSTDAAEATVPDGYKLALGIRAVIALYCNITTDFGVTTAVKLKDGYLGFPGDVHLPDGAVSIAFDPAEGTFKSVPAAHALPGYSKMDYVYPASRQYFADSRLSVSRTAVPADMEAWTWDAVLDAFADGRSITGSTVSAALETPVRPGVTRLDVVVSSLDEHELYVDFADNEVDVTNSIMLKSILVGGQRAASWDFTPMGAKVYTMHNLISFGTEAARTTKRGTPTITFFSHLLPSAQSAVNIALGFVNHCPDFVGDDGRIIYNDSVFYLLGTLKSSDGQPLFQRGGKVTAHFTLLPDGLGKAVLALPDLSADDVEYEGAFTITLNVEDE